MRILKIAAKVVKIIDIRKDFDEKIQIPRDFCCRNSEIPRDFCCRNSEIPNENEHKLRFPLYPAEAGWEFFAVFFVMCDTGTTHSVPRTSFFCARTVDMVMRTGHI